MKNILTICFISFALFSCSTQSKKEKENKDIDMKIESLLKQMTLEEKIEQIAGIGFDTKYNKRLGIPTLGMTDGPVGIRWGTATALPAAVSMASTWDTALIRRIGILLGKETKALGRNLFLGPCVNIHRFPIGGRNFESFGEDPYLAGQIAIPYIKGVQSQNVIACVKHFACNNQEWKRSSVSANVDERALHEIYLPAFKAAVQEGDVWSVMSSYNKLNGTWTSENEYLLNDVLKKQWGFKGFVVSDWGATHSTVASAKAGLDLEMPWGDFYNDSLIKIALNKKEITESMIDDKVRRLLRSRFNAGLFDSTKNISKDILTSDEHKKIAYEAAVNGIVLLKNDKNILPIDLSKNKKIAVIGPNAAFARIGGGGSSKVTPFYAVSALDGLKSRIGDRAEINYAVGAVPTGEVQIIDNRYFGKTKEAKGLKAEYFKNIKLEGNPLYEQIDKDVNYLWYYDAPRMDMHGADDANYFSVRWTGKVTAPKTGEYTFQVLHNDGVRLKVSNKTIIDKWNDNSASIIDEGKITLTAGQHYDIVLEYYNNAGISEIKLGWEIPNTDLLKEAVDLAKKSDLAILFVGLSDHFEGEGRDREYLVLENQDKLIESVLAVNPNTIVVMITGTPAIIESWADKVPSIVQAWFAGQEGGNAIADILLGYRNPSGKLPCSFYKSKEQSPGFDDYKDASLQSNYKEGIYVGYRYLDKKRFEARFPFGHGLSYTQFYYDTLKYNVNNNNVEVSIQLTNTGKYDGAEVVQVYINPVKTSVDRPEKELKAFQKIFLKSGESRKVTFTINEKSFQYYNAQTHQWEIDKGKYNILIGSSSKDIRQIVSDITISPA